MTERLAPDGVDTRSYISGFNAGRREGLREASRIVLREASRRDTTGQALRTFLCAAIRACADLIDAETARPPS